MSAFNEWVELEYEVTQASNALAARVNASPLGLSTPYFLDDFEDVQKAYRDGPYSFVLEGGFPKFSEVREINDRISDYVEAVLEQKMLYIHHLNESQDASRKSELFDESQTLRLQNNRERRAIWDMANHLASEWGP